MVIKIRFVNIFDGYQFSEVLIFMRKKILDKLQLTGWNLGQVFDFRSSFKCAMHLLCYEAKQPNLKLNTCPKQLLGSLPIAFGLPDKMDGYIAF